MRLSLLLRLEGDHHVRPALVEIVAVCLLLALLFVLWGDSPRANATVQALPQPSGGFYLTSDRYTAVEAPNSCTDGYHMAALWEILDPSHLAYDVTLGLTAADSGFGPPTGSAQHGWLRTGYGSATSPPAGQANCSTWTSTSGVGTIAYLPDNWTAGAQDMDVWVVSGSAACGAAVPRVWCASHQQLYFPILYRH